jgi:hypothetical protein
VTVWHVLFPLFVVLPAVINGVAMRGDPKHGDAFGLSLMILALWVGQTALSLFMPIPNRAGYNAVFDFIALLTILGCWMRHRAAWMPLLMGLYVTQIYLACAFWWGWTAFDRAIGYGDYAQANNLIWFAELVCVSATGGTSVVRRAIDRMRSRSHAYRGVGLVA